MSNPWLKSNPFMSMWLSGFNQMTGHVTSQAKRQITAAVTKATKDNLKTMSDTVFPASSKAKPKTKAKPRMRKPAVKK